MRCGFCGRAFDDDSAQDACAACTLFGGCKKVTCPHCGYEMPRETRLVKAIRRWRARKDD